MSFVAFQTPFKKQLIRIPNAKNSKCNQHNSELIYWKDVWYASGVSLLDGEWVVTLEVIPCTPSIYRRCIRFPTTVLARLHTYIHTHTYNGMCMNAINRRHSFVSRVWSSARIASRSRSVTNASAHSDAHEVPIALVFYKVPRCFVYVIFFSGFRCAGSVGSRLFAEWVPDTAERSVDLGDF